MGLFDIGIKKEINLKKNPKPLNLLQEKISNDSEDKISIENNKLLLNNFKPKGFFLKFNLESHVLTDGKKGIIVIDGELQQVLFLVVLIVLAILFTWGLGVILVVGFVYYQKHLATKYLNNIIDSNLT